MPIVTDLEQVFQRIVGEVTEADEALKKMIQLLARVRANTKVIREFVEKATPSKLRELTFDIRDEKSVNLIITKALKITQKNLDKAIKKAPEYSNPLFYLGLQKVISNPNLYKILRSGRVEIQMDRYAGSLSDYAEAVKAIRREGGYDDEAGLHTHKVTTKTGKGYRKISRTDKVTPISRSENWEKFVSPRGTKLKQQILNKRNLYSGGVYAPYWELLEKGNVNAAMSSNLGRGAYPTPINKPTHFIADSESEINAYVKSLVDKTAKATGGEIFTKEDLVRIESLLKTTEDYVKTFTQVVEDGPDPLEPQKFQVFISDVNKHYRLITTRVVAVDEKIKQMRAGAVPITRTRTVTLGYREYGDVLRRVRIRLTTLENLLRGRQ